VRKSAIGIAAISLLALTTSAQSAPTDVVFWGGLNVDSTSGCTGWNPVKQTFWGTYWVPVAGSTNGPDSVLSLLNRGGGGEGFQLNNGVFTTTYKTVNAVHVFTRIGTYSAQVKIKSQVPATILTTTPRITISGSIKGFDSTPTCVVNFSANMVRNLEP
jgi:hypothetical protein